jgi:glycosyltransferase involved in cell wall biosynthesis
MSEPTMPSPCPKIIHVTESMAADTLAFLAQATRELAASGVCQVVLYSPRSDTPQDLSAMFDARVELMALPSPSQGIVRYARTLRDELLRLLIEPDVAAVHLHASRAGFVGRIALLGTRLRVPVFYSPHGLACLNRKYWLPSLVYTGLERLAARTRCTLVGCGRSEAALLTRIGRRPARVLENAVDDDFFEIVRHETKPPLVLSIGRVCRQKAPERFAALAARFQIAEVPARFVWVGAGDAAGEACLRASGVEVTGWVEPDQVRRWLEQASVYVQTSRWEGMPLSVLQALAAGVPCVVHDAVGNRDAVRQGITGFVARNTDEAVMTVQRLLHDETLRRRFSLAARRDAHERFSSASFRTRLLRLYGLTQLIEAQAAAPRHYNVARLPAARLPAARPVLIERRINTSRVPYMPERRASARSLRA